jgi:hypothetical protein
MPQSGETILNSIAICILAGMMLLPLVNLFVGAIVGAGVSGTFGLFSGALLAFLIMVVEIVWLRARRRQLATGADETQPRTLLPSRTLSRVIVNLSEWRHLRMGLGVRRNLNSAPREPLEGDLRQAA